MALRSMTGFASRDGSAGSFSWHWDVRSVNSRGFDLRLRLPPGLEGLEARLREAVARRIVRGSVAVSLGVKRTEGTTQIRLNETALQQVLAALERLKAIVDVSAPRADGLLSVRGVLEFAEPEESEAEAKARNDAMLRDFEQALDELLAGRVAEGRRLEAIVLDQLAAIDRLIRQVGSLPARSSDAVRARLKEQIGRLLEATTAFDETRLYQEAALLATRADIEEELQRIRSHIAAARELIGSDEPAGRRLDFLAQEFNREANTLCSKSGDTETTRAGLELKAVIDQMREQVQNIE